MSGNDGQELTAQDASDGAGEIDTTSATDDQTPHGEASDGQDQETETGDDEHGENRNREAARYRVERNQARRERDGARQQVVDLQAALVDHLAAAAGLSDVGLLTYEGFGVGDLLGDDGVPDAQKVQQAVAAVMAKHRIPRRPAPVPAGGNPSFSGVKRADFADGFRPQPR